MMKIETNIEHEDTLEECAWLMDQINDFENRLEEVSIAIADYEDIHYSMDKPSM